MSRHRATAAAPLSKISPRFQKLAHALKKLPSYATSLTFPIFRPFSSFSIFPIFSIFSTLPSFSTSRAFVSSGRWFELVACYGEGGKGPPLIASPRAAGVAAIARGPGFQIGDILRTRYLFCVGEHSSLDSVD